MVFGPTKHAVSLSGARAGAQAFTCGAQQGSCGVSTTGFDLARATRLRIQSGAACERAHPTCEPASNRRELSVSQHVFVVGHRVLTVRLAGVGARRACRLEIGGSCQAPRCRRAFSTTRAASMTAITRIVAEPPTFSRLGRSAGRRVTCRAKVSQSRLEASAPLAGSRCVHSNQCVCMKPRRERRHSCRPAGWWARRADRNVGAPSGIRVARESGQPLSR